MCLFRFSTEPRVCLLYFCHVSVKKGSHPRFPGHSCKEIKDLGESRGDGEYSIDPGNTGQPFTVYCDMTTDSGIYPKKYSCKIR